MHALKPRPEYESQYQEDVRLGKRMELNDEDQAFLNQCTLDGYYQRSLPVSIASAGSVLLYYFQKYGSLYEPGSGVYNERGYYGYVRPRKIFMNFFYFKIVIFQFVNSKVHLVLKANF